MKHKNMDRFLRLREVVVITGLSESTIYRLERYKKDFPARRRLSAKGRSVGWLASEIEQWVASRRASE